MKRLWKGIKRHRWMVFVIVGASFDGNGYQGPIGDLLAKLFYAAAVWTWAFDHARAGSKRPLRDVVSPEQERWILFALAVVMAFLIAASGANRTGIMLERFASFTLDVVIAATIARQGYRIGSRRLSSSEYGDEFIYGSLGNLAVLVPIAGAVIVLGAVPSGLELLLIVTPIGLIAMSDEPLYVRAEPYVRRHLMRQKRWREGITEELW